MYPNFNRPETRLTGADLAALRALYGARQADALEGAGGNDTFASATALGLSGTSGAPWSAAVEGDVTTHQDVDVYRLRVVDGVTALDIKVKTAGVSLLVPRLTVYASKVASRS